VRLEQADQLFIGRHRLAVQHPAFGLVEYARDQRQIMAHLEAPALGHDAGKLGAGWRSAAAPPGWHERQQPAYDRAGAGGRSRVIRRTASHNSALSLGWWISAAVTVPSIRSMAPTSTLACPAAVISARLTAPQVSARIALMVAVATLPSLHRDPFDRILVAQSIIEGIVLLTADPVVAQYPAPVRQV
jgi:PIN domain nuclease of toxin-antitoxin system